MDSAIQKLQQLGRHFQPQLVKNNTVKVVVTGAAGNIGYTLVHMIAQGHLLGPYQPINLTLVELPSAKQQLEGTLMELYDCASPLLREINGTTDYREGFKDAQIVILVGARPRGPGMERKDLLGLNAIIFRDQGRALNDVADKNVKVLVVGNPANTNALICSHFAPSIPKENFTSLTRLDQNRAISMLGQKLNTPVQNIKNVIIWGNHSVTQFADVSHGTLSLKDGTVKSIYEAVADDEWVQKQFTVLVAKRGGAILEQRKSTSAASAANAICDHIHDWIIGSKEGEYVSMGVMTSGNIYGLPNDINFSLPCTIKDGKVRVVENLKWDQFSQSMIDRTKQELLEEKDMAFAYLSTQK